MNIYHTLDGRERKIAYAHVQGLVRYRLTRKGPWHKLDFETTIEALSAGELLALGSCMSGLTEVPKGVTLEVVQDE